MKTLVHGTKVLDIVLHKKMGYLETGFTQEKINHRTVADKIREMKLSSILVFRSPLAPELVELPRYATRKTLIMCSQVEEVARQRMTNKYMSIEEAKKLLIENEVDISAGNIEEDNHQTHLSKLYDYVFRAQEMALYPEILQEMKEASRYVYDEDTDEEKELTDEELEASWEKTKLSLLLPKTSWEWERIHDLPDCLQHWDYRNNFQQYFFAEDSEVIWRAKGGVGGSGSRWDLGIMIHAFAYLHAEGITIPTTVLHYNSINELHRLAEFLSFRCVYPSLGSNYHNPWGNVDTEFLVKNICVTENDFIKQEI